MNSGGLEERVRAWYGGLFPDGLKITAVVVLGSGLDGGASAVSPELEIDYGEVPGLLRGGVPGHRSLLRLGRIMGERVAVFRGRRHYYETGSMAETAMPVRIGAALGARLLISLAAVGGIDATLPVGSWAGIADHVNLMGVNPLLGVSGEGGPPFVDLSRVYRKELYEDVRSAASGLFPIGKAVLAAFSGPTYETPAEVEMARRLGAGVVGMSTVPEAVWAKYLGIDALAYGRIANAASGISEIPLSHADILAESEKASEEAGKLIEFSFAAWFSAERSGR